MFSQQQVFYITSKVIAKLASSFNSVVVVFFSTVCMQCHVFIQEDGERSIVMAPASTSIIDAQAVQEYFGGYSFDQQLKFNGQL